MQFMTDKNVELELTAIPPVLLERVEIEVENRFEADGEPINTPTFQLETVGGDLQTFELTEKNLNPADPKDAELRQAQWNAYVNARGRLRMAQTEARLKFLLTWGVDVDLPEDDKWQKLVKAAGVPIPEDKDELRFVYLWYHLLTPFEVKRISVDLDMLAYGKAVSQEDVDTFHQNTEDSIRLAARAVIARSVSNISAAVAKEAQAQSVQQPTAERGESGAVVEPDAEPVG